MCFTTDKIEHACGFLLLNEFNSFIYCCKNCQHEYDSGIDLESHILSAHEENKKNVPANEVQFEYKNEPTHEEPPIEIITTNIKLEFEDEDNQCEQFQESYDGLSSDNDDVPLVNLSFKNESNDESYNLSRMVDEECDNELDNNISDQKRRRGRPKGSKNKIKPVNDADDDAVIKPEPESQFPKSSRGRPKGSKNIKRPKTDNSKPKRPKGRPFGSKNKRYTEEELNERMKSPHYGTFYCDMCPDQPFKSKLSLFVHMRRHVRNEVRQRCAICNKRPRNLESHMSKSHPCEPFKCEYCDAKFNTYVGLKVHTKHHTAKRPSFLCGYCGKSFISQSNWQSHENRMHRKEAKFKCEQCDRKFYTGYRLRDHINIFHSHERPFECETCGKCFATKNYLRIHKYSHGEPTFACKHCGKKFRMWVNKNKHEKDIHKVIELQ